MLTFRRLLLGLALIGLAAADAFGHGDVHKRILELTEEITRTPTNTALFLQRADMFRVDGNFTNALSDLESAERLDPGAGRVNFFRGRIFLEANQPQIALECLDRYLAGKPKDSEAFATRARARVKVGKFVPATEDFTTAIGINTMGPELFIERAEAWRAAGNMDQCLKSLDEGIRRLGPLVTLELPAIDYEVGLKRYDAAIARIDTVSARLQRKETWLLRRGEILRLAGREEEARRTFREGLLCLDRLPLTHRNTRATQELEAKLQAALNPAPKP